MLPSYAVALGLLLVALTVPAEGADCGATPMSPADAATAVEFVAARVSSAHIGSIGPPPQAAVAGFEAARELARRSPRQRDLVDALNRALAAFGDAHLELRMSDAARAGCRALPIRLAWNASGLWIQSGLDPAPTGSRVEAIGPLDTASLQRVMTARIPHETVQWLRHQAAEQLVREDALRVLDLVDGSGRVAVRIVAPDGRRRTVRLALQAHPAESREGWFGYRVDPAASTGHFWFQRFEYGAAIAAAFDAFLREAAGVDKIAIDIRGNSGGDSTVAVAMLDALTSGRYSAFSVEVRPSPELAAAMPMLMPGSLNPVLTQAGLPAIPAAAASFELPAPMVLAQLRGRAAASPVTERLEGRRLFLLTDSGTFSSGALFAVLVRDNRLGTIVGEPGGNTATFNGSEIRLDVPGLDCQLNLSTGRLHRPDRTAPANAAIEPDLLVVPDGADLAAARDPVLDAVRRLE